MEHRYIDQRSLADRYLDHTLSPPERAEFETHLVDCQECRDRLLLAEMFHNRNGIAKSEPAPSPSPLPSPVPIAPANPPDAPANPPETMRVRFVRQFTPWQILAILAAAALVLVLATAAGLFWVLRFGSVLR